MDVLKTQLLMGLISLFLISCNPFGESEQESSATESSQATSRDAVEESSTSAQETAREGAEEEELIPIVLPDDLAIAVPATSPNRRTWSIDPPVAEAHLFQTDWQIADEGWTLELKPGWNYIPTVPSTQSSFLEWLKSSEVANAATVVLQNVREQWYGWGTSLAHKKEDDGSLSDGSGAGQELDTGYLSSFKGGYGFWVFLTEIPSNVSLFLPGSFLVDPIQIRNGLNQDSLVRLGVEQALNTRSVGGAVLREYTPEEESITTSTSRNIRQSLQDLEKLLNEGPAPQTTSPTSRNTERTLRPLGKDQTNVVLEQLTPILNPTNSRLQRQIAVSDSFESRMFQRVQSTARDLQASLDDFESLTVDEQREVLNQWIETLTPPSLENYRPQPAEQIVRKQAPVVSDESLFEN